MVKCSPIVRTDSLEDLNLRVMTGLQGSISSKEFVDAEVRGSCIICRVCVTHQPEPLSGRRGRMGVRPPENCTRGLTPPSELSE
jgi:hypothetical protein